MGVNGDLYFSNVLFNDSVADYCCNARFPYKNVIQQKMPVVVKVITSEFDWLFAVPGGYFCCHYHLCQSTNLTFPNHTHNYLDFYPTITIIRQVLFEVHVTDILSVLSVARTVAEAAPTWLSPRGSSTSILVLLGEELLLECIAAGVYVKKKDYMIYCTVDLFLHTCVCFMFNMVFNLISRK